MLAMILRVIEIGEASHGAQTSWITDVRPQSWEQNKINFRKRFPDSKSLQVKLEKIRKADQVQICFNWTVFK